MKAWFRMYAEFANDPKVQLLAFEDQRHFVVLLCLKCQGTLDSVAPSEEYRDRMIARALGLSPDASVEAKRRLLEIGIIREDWHPSNWASRQFESDSSVERTRAYRERKEKKRHGDVTVTLQNRTDTEQNRTETEAPAVAGLDRPSWDRWESYRRDIGKPLTPASMQAAQRKLAAFGTDQSAVVEHSIANGWTGLFRPDQATKPKEREFIC